MASYDLQLTDEQTLFLIFFGWGIYTRDIYTKTVLAISNSLLTRRPFPIFCSLPFFYFTDFITVTMFSLKFIKADNLD